MATQTLDQSLSDALKAKVAQSRERIPDDALAVMDRATVELRESGIVDRSLAVGETAPLFELPNALGETIRLKDALNEGPVVLSFYRGQWCPYCNLELRALQKHLPEIEARGARLIAVSAQTPDNTLSTTEKHGLEYEVLSDLGNHVSRQYGLVFSLPADLRDVYEQFGIDLRDVNGDDRFELPVPAVYVIDTDRTIRYAFADADYTKRANPDDILATLDDLKA